MEHLEFFQLPADPFQNDADARFYFESAPQKRARLRLLRGIHQRKGLAVLEGGPGLGKTTLAHVILRTLEDKEYAAHYLSVPHEACATGWFLPNVARAFGVPVLASQVSQLIDQIHAQLVAIVTARRMPVLLIDEAQLFRNREAMEEFRGLLNLTHEGKKLISLVLFGLPELGELLKLDPALAQRVEVRVEMGGMDWLESQAYVAHRLRLAGATQAVFAPDALESLFRWSGGVPRLLNTLADNALFEGFLTETKPIDSSVVISSAQALGLMRIPSDSVPNIPPPSLPAPDLLASTAVELPPRPAPAMARAKAEPARPAKPAADTIAISKPSPVAARGPKIELDDAFELDESPKLAEESTDSSPDWLEPLSPMPDEVPAEAAPAKSLAAPEPIELEAAAEEPELVDLEQVVAEDTSPPTPAPLAIEASLELEAMLGSDESEEEEPALGAEAEPAADDDDADFSLGSLVAADGDGDEEAILAELGPASEPEPEDLAPVRRTMPTAKPSPLARPATPAKAAPAKPTPSKPVATPAKVTPAKPKPAPDAEEDGFDLRNLVDDEPATGPKAKPAMAVAAAPAKDEDDDLDALFDEIQIGDK